MLATSVSLPVNTAISWKRQQRAIMKFAVRILRLTMRQKPPRRGVKRMYNHAEGGYEIVTTRFTEAEYDALHFAAATMRVSVSWLVYQMILLWQKPSRRLRENPFLTNYEAFVSNWGQNSGILTETLFFWPKNWRHHPPDRLPF
ncbi:MAG: hypothetical protein JSR44_07895 [Spirochaetes bacterium]|nr:hypothetical protein [Spirochaetota bacterium]